MSPAPKQKSAGTWVYCVVRSGRAPVLTKAPEGPPGTGRPRALEVGDGLFLVVSDAPLDVYGDAAVNKRLKDLDWVSQCALAHEGVVQFARKAPALLPIKLFTLFHSDERAAAWAEGEKKRLVRALDRVEGCSEFGVRLTLDDRRARQRVDGELGRKAAPATGAAFLMRKKQVRDVAQDLLRGAQDAADELFADLQKVAKDARRRTEVEGLAPGSRLVLDGVFLVADAKKAKFQAAIKRAAKTLEPKGYDLVLNGPWPPYHFVADAA